MHSSTRSQDMERRTKWGAILFPARTRRKQAEKEIKWVLQCQLQKLRLTQLGAAKKGGKVSTIQRLEAVKRGQNPRSGLCYFMGVCTLKKLSVCH